MKFCICIPTRYLWTISVVGAGLLLSCGCGDSASKDPVVASGEQSVTATVDLNDAGGESERGGKNLDAANELTSNRHDQESTTPATSSSSKKKYAPIFEKDLEQNTISNRMESNFAHYFQKSNESAKHHFKSAGIKMLKPDGLELAKGYTGFQSKLATISLLTNPFSMKDTTDSIIDDAMNQANSAVLFLKDVVVDGYSGKFYVNVVGLAGGYETANISLAFGDDSFSWILKGTYLTKDEMVNDLGAKMLEALLSARVADEPRTPPGEYLDYTIRPNVLKLNDGFIDKLIFTKGGEFPINRVDEPIFQISKVPKRVNVSDRKQFAQLMISPTSFFKKEMVSSQAEIEIDGLKGYEFVSLATDTVSKEPLQMYSVSLFTDDAAYVMCGWVSSLNTENHIQNFRQLARSFRRKDSAANDSSNTK